MLESTSNASTEMDSTDSDCFDVNFTTEAIGSSANAIRSILKRLQKSDQSTTIFVKFTNVPPQVAADQKFPKGYRRMYNLQDRSLIVTIPNGPHDSAVSNFTRLFSHTATTASIPVTAFTSLGSKRVEGFYCSKEPDGSLYTVSTPLPGIKRWPTIVIEVGFSEAKKKLRSDAAWWIANSEAQTNTVITISIHKSVAEITFEVIVPIYPIRILRNSRRRYESEVRQSIVVSRPPGGQNQPILTTPNGPLKISCQELLCRPPIPPEVDPDISVQTLEEVALLVWYEQGV